MRQIISTLHSQIVPLAVLQRFYLGIEKIALEKAFNPEQPSGLKK